MSITFLRHIRPTKAVAAIAAGGISLGIYSRMMTDSAHADSGSPSKVFGSGPAFVLLPLESSEVVNHNTKRLRFRLPDENAPPF
ncbi:hypothetical protein BN1723_005395 [Verticillium longisporum]|uniref:Uncharacterized protein n=1 Tax=Verticillium longisporum TaxID=100787 RepID=A0A0G4N805_VERLO|nr:hypothetical protein BN1723_005395 [Verticillium longisporum]